MIEFEIQPGSAVGNDAGVEQQFAGGMGFTPIMIKENAWRPVQLGNDNSLGTVDDKCSRIGHEGNFPHVDFLPLDLLDDLGRRG